MGRIRKIVFTLGAIAMFVIAAGIWYNSFATLTFNLLTYVFAFGTLGMIFLIIAFGYQGQRDLETFTHTMSGQRLKQAKVVLAGTEVKLERGRKSVIDIDDSGMRRGELVARQNLVDKKYGSVTVSEKEETPTPKLLVYGCKHIRAKSYDNRCPDCGKKLRKTSKKKASVGEQAAEARRAGLLGTDRAGQW